MSDTQNRLAEAREWVRIHLDTKTWKDFVIDDAITRLEAAAREPLEAEIARLRAQVGAGAQLFEVIHEFYPLLASLAMEALGMGSDTRGRELDTVCRAIVAAERAWERAASEEEAAPA